MLIALALTIAHLSAIVWIAAPQAKPLIERYHTLVSHDSYWFLNIIQRGYQSTIPPHKGKMMEVSNVAFFPAFPLFGRFFVKTLALGQKTGLLTATHVATWGFWTYVLLFLRRWNVSLGALLLVVGLIISHPAAMFTITAYSESLFLMMLLGYMFWHTQQGVRYAQPLAAAHGFVMTATRIAGILAAFYPVVNALAARSRRLFSRIVAARIHEKPTPRPPEGITIGARQRPQAGFYTGHRALISAAEFARAEPGPIWVSLVALLGALSFFAFCQWRFGHWNFYMQTQLAGWGVHADYLALLKPGAYARFWPTHAFRIPWELGQFSVPLTMLTFVGLAWWEIRAARARPTRWRERIGFYFVGFALFFIAVSGVYSVRLESMIRYQFCTYIFIVLAAAHAFGDARPESTVSRRFIIGAALFLILISAYIQYLYAAIFTHGGWVA